MNHVLHPSEILGTAFPFCKIPRAKYRSQLLQPLSLLPVPAQCQDTIIPSQPLNQILSQKSGRPGYQHGFSESLSLPVLILLIFVLDLAALLRLSVFLYHLLFPSLSCTERYPISSVSNISLRHCSFHCLRSRIVRSTSSPSPDGSFKILPNPSLSNCRAFSICSPCCGHIRHGTP